ncbi:MAG TPA: hypothetical protein DGG94_23015 [Micromonosporaceae bacterium]|nr:hypothetical protein [Micromonosporaceae bacterium]
MSEPVVHGLLRSAKHSAIHLELRDSYTPDDPDWIDWREGRRFDPAQRWHEWFTLVSETTARGVQMRRARIVSEPVTDYIQFEYDVTAGHNIAAGEQVRWLPRRQAWDLLIPACDFWIFDNEVVVLNVFDGNGDWVTEERHDDPAVAARLADAFDEIWDRATNHEVYRPA